MTESGASGGRRGLPKAAVERAVEALLQARRAREEGPPENPTEYTLPRARPMYVSDFHASGGEPYAPLAAGYVPEPGERLLKAFLRRYTDLLFRLGEAAPSEALEDALAAPDDVGGLARLLARLGPMAAPAPDPLAAARARGAEAKGRLLAKAGGALRAGEVAARLGVTPQAVHARRQRGTLLAVPQANGEWVYPACQLGPAGALPGLAEVLRAFNVDDPWTRLSVLLSPADGAGSRTPLELLAAGRAREAAEAVARYGEHLA